MHFVQLNNVNPPPNRWLPPPLSTVTLMFSSYHSQNNEMQTYDQAHHYITYRESCFGLLCQQQNTKVKYKTKQFVRSDCIYEWIQFIITSTRIPRNRWAFANPHRFRLAGRKYETFNQTFTSHHQKYKRTQSFGRIFLIRFPLASLMLTTSHDSLSRML